MDIAAIMRKVCCLGAGITRIIYDDITLYLISYSKYNHVLLIPDEPSDKIVDDTMFPLFKDKFELSNKRELPNISGKLKVFGGKSLHRTTGLFSKLNLDEIDISCLDTRNVKDMSTMFLETGRKNKTATKIVGSENLNTSNVEHMDCMFCNASLDGMSFLAFDTRSLNSAHSMFYSFHTNDSIDLSNFNISKLKVADQMFYSCEAPSINLSSFNRQIDTMDRIFCLCKTNRLDISNLKYPFKVTKRLEMFEGFDSYTSFPTIILDKSETLIYFEALISNRGIIIDKNNGSIEYIRGIKPDK